MGFKITNDPIYGEVIDIIPIQSDLFDIDVPTSEMLYYEYLSDTCNRTIETSERPDGVPVGKVVQ